MNILVTGGLGYIGSHTCIKLIEAGYTPIIVDNLYNSKKCVLDRIEQITGVMPTFYYGSVLDDKFLNSIFKSHTIDAVIHLAGLKAVGESVTKPLEYYEQNVYGSVVLTKVMRDNNVKNLIFSSSATVYGDDNTPPFNETMPTGKTTNPYGTSKHMVENILKDVSASDADFSITLLRYFNPVGAHKSGLIGEDPKGIPNNLMPYIAQVAVGKLECLSVYGDDYETKDGTGVRDFIHVEDLALGHVAALSKINQKGVHIYNLGTGEGSSVLEAIKSFEKVATKKINYKITPRRAGDIAVSVADVSKAKKELNWTSIYNLDQMTKDSWHWQTKNPNGFDD